VGNDFEDDDNVLTFLVLPFLEQIQKDPTSQPSSLTIFVTDNKRFNNAIFNKQVFFQKKGTKMSF
jgi:hypothetical protein